MNENLYRTQEKSEKIHEAYSSLNSMKTAIDNLMDLGKNEFNKKSLTNKNQLNHKASKLSSDSDVSDYNNLSYSNPTNENLFYNTTYKGYNIASKFGNYVTNLNEIKSDKSFVKKPSANSFQNQTKNMQKTEDYNTDFHKRKYLIENQKIIELEKVILEYKILMDDLENKYSKLKFENDSIWLSNQNLLKENRILKGDNEEIVNQVIQLKKENFEIQQEYFNKKEDQEDIMQINEKLNAIIEQNYLLNYNIKEKDEEINSLKKALQNFNNSSQKNEAEIEKNKNFIEIQNSELGKKNSQIEQLCYDNNILKDQIENLKSKLDQMNKNLSEFEDHDNNNKSLFEKHQTEIERLNSKLSLLNEIIDEKETTIIKLKNSLEILNKNIEDFSNHNENLRQQNNLINNEKSQLIKKVESLQIDCDKYKLNIEKINSQINDLKEENLILDSSLKTQKKNHQDTVTINQGLEIEKAGLNEKISEAEMEIKTISQINIESQNKIIEYEGLITELKSLILNNENNVLSFKSQIENLENKCILKDETINSLIQNKEELNNILLNLKDKNSNLQEEKNILEKLREEMSNNFKINELKLQKEIEKLSKEIYTNENTRTSTIKSFNDIKLKYERLLKDVEDEKMLYNREILDLKQKLSILTEYENNLKIENSELKKDLGYKSQEITSLKGIIKENQENLSVFNTQIEKYKYQTEELQEKLPEKEKICENYLNDIEKLNKKINELEKQKENQIQSYQDLLGKYHKGQNEIYENKILKEKFENLYLNLKDNSNTFNSSPQLDNSNIIKKKVNKDTTNSNINLQGNTLSENQDNHIHKTQKKFKIESNKIVDGYNQIYTIYDSRRILKFDIEERKFKIIEFADFDNFEGNFNSQGSLYLNYSNYLIIVTGKNNDIVYFYDSFKHTMKKLLNLNDNHCHGGLIEKEGIIYCLSGWNNKKFEYFTNKDLKKPNYNDLAKLVSNKSEYLPDLNIERSEFSSLIYKNKIYVFFGYNLPQNKFLDTIEVFDLEKAESWNFLDFTSSCSFKTIKSFGISLMNDNESLFIGGDDGNKEEPIQSFSTFNFEANTWSEKDVKLSEIENYHIFSFSGHNNGYCYTDSKNLKYSIFFDTKENVHLIQNDNFSHDIFCFDH